jgi:hypothetical protein
VKAPLPLVAALGLVGVVGLLVVSSSHRPPASPRDLAASGDRPGAEAAGGGASTVGPTTTDRAPDDQEPRGDFVFLFDVSSSVHTGGAGDPFSEAVAILEPAVLRLKELELFLPERFRVGTIGAASLMQRPLCDFRAEATGIFTRKDSAAFFRKLRECVSRLRGLAPERASDLRGALHYASLTLRGDRPATRGIILVSDLVEVIPAGRTPAIPDLHDLCIAVYSLMTPAGAEHPDSLERLEQSWRRRLSDWGARAVRVQSVLGFDALDLANFFRSCKPV